MKQHGVMNQCMGVLVAAGVLALVMTAEAGPRKPQPAPVASPHRGNSGGERVFNGTPDQIQGSIRFGDPHHGARPPSPPSSPSTAYRVGPNAEVDEAMGVLGALRRPEIQSAEPRERSNSPASSPAVGSSVGGGNPLSNVNLANLFRGLRGFEALGGRDLAASGGLDWMRGFATSDSTGWASSPIVTEYDDDGSSREHRDLDGDGQYDTTTYYDSDGTMDGVVYDENEDGKPEYVWAWGVCVTGCERPVDDSAGYGGGGSSDPGDRARARQFGSIGPGNGTVDPDSQDAVYGEFAGLGMAIPQQVDPAKKPGDGMTDPDPQDSSGGSAPSSSLGGGGVPATALRLPGFGLVNPVRD